MLVTYLIVVSGGATAASFGRVDAPRLVNFVLVALVKVNNEDGVVSEAADPVHRRHDDNEGE